ncbi:winged helix-turn-helix domain-containing protein [Catelliglobosispora koreensis]|uniref:winged helix-turn-helix domain-containing protein n=1 Tax=Catelliglobosispora koreensis TaxID=129052 RepID=UPI00035E8D0B|nr:winged helix-turn-helix domain-containing protein [Catelliglobosispora koreensis]
MGAAVSLLEQPDKVRLALSPLRRQLLERLRTPGSAAQLAAELSLPRQRVGYHLRLLEQAGLIEQTGQRQRRGCQERLMRTTAADFVVDPQVMTDAHTGDRVAAEQLLAVASETVRQVARMQAGAEQQGTRLLTFAAEARVRFAEPADVHRFTDALAEAIAQVVATFDTEGGRPYRLIAGGHPAPAASALGAAS